MWPVHDHGITIREIYTYIAIISANNIKIILKPSGLIS